MAKMIELNWQGPFRLGDPTAAELPHNESGVYLWTVPVNGVHIVNYVGESSAILARWSQHYLFLLGGRYVVYDPDSLRRGESPLKVIYEDKGVATNLTSFSESVARMAYENAKICSLFWAHFDGDKPLRRAVESAIYSSVLLSGSAARLLSNGSVSIASANAIKIRCRLRWPSGVRVAGLPDAIDFGEIELT